MGLGTRGPARPPGGGADDPMLGVLTPSGRDRVLQALTECCAERGYQATTVAEVVDRAGVARESFDLLFTGKEDCAIAALNKLASEVLTTAVSASGAGEQKLAGLRAAVGLLARQPTYAYLGCVEARQGGTERMRQTYEANLNLITVMLSRTQAEGGALPAGAARAALGGAEALARREIAAGRASRLPEILPALIYGAMAPLLGQEEALQVARAAAEPEGEGR